MILRHPWSKLQKELYKIFDERLDIQFHCIVYRMTRGRNKGQDAFPRYTVQLGRVVVWDYPRDFMHIIGKMQITQTGKFVVSGTGEPIEREYQEYVYYPDYGLRDYNVCHILFEYLNTPKDELLSFRPEYDFWGLVDILLAADKRIGKRRFSALRERTGGNEIVEKILQQREQLSVK